jgi:hypothetical protein
MINMHKYYCNKCKRYHHRGKIFKEHIKYKKEKKPKVKDKSSDDESLKVNIDNLRPIAKRQLKRLVKKANRLGNYELYKNEIIKLIKNEKRR